MTTPTTVGNANFKNRFTMFPDFISSSVTVSSSLTIPGPPDILKPAFQKPGFEILKLSVQRPGFDIPGIFLSLSGGRTCSKRGRLYCVSVDVDFLKFYLFLRDRDNKIRSSQIVCMRS